LIVCDQPERVGRWVCERAGGSWVPGRGTAIGLERNGRLVAGVIFDDFNGANINMHVASDGSRGWLNREYLWFCFYYPFVQLGVKRITGIVPECNEAAARFDEHIGFELEARLKDAHPDGDLLIYKMTSDKCRWLHLKG
jgi:RimJ/RimL family protein N-acetyltransferase